jgi:hypothetical protein
MEPEGSLPSSQEPAINAYPEPAESIQHLHTLFLSSLLQAQC